MTPGQEENIREMLTRFDLASDVADEIIQWYRRRDGDAREDLLLEAVDDGVLVVYGFNAKEGPLYFSPEPDGGPYWLQPRPN